MKDLKNASTDLFRTCLRRQVSTVAIITTCENNLRAGATATAVSSISATPPTMLVSLNRSSTTSSVVSRSGLLCINFVDEAQLEIARVFAEPAPSLAAAADKFLRSDNWRDGPGGLPVLEGAAASLCCRVEQAIESHTHTLFIARVEQCAFQELARPLLYGFGTYMNHPPADALSCR